MEIFVNGERVEVKEGATLEAALAELGYRREEAAAAVNETFVPRQALASRRLARGDRVDVIKRIEGG